MSLLKNKRRISLRQLKYGNSETRVAVTILLFVICSWSVPAQENIQFRVACWNTENLFDTRHDSLKNDYEFLPNAIRHWNYNKYKKKLDKYPTLDMISFGPTLTEYTLRTNGCLSLP